MYTTCFKTIKSPPPPPPLPPSPLPPPVEEDIDADLIGLVPRDTDILGRVFIEPAEFSWYPASKEVNEAVRESVMRLFTYSWYEWWDIPIVSKLAMFQEFKTMCCWLAKHDQAISIIFERHAAMSYQIAHLTRALTQAAAPDSSSEEKIESDKEFVGATP